MYFLMESHPSLLESPILSSRYSQLPQPPIQQPELSKYKQFGQKIKQAFFITILFALFVNSFIVLDKINFVFTHRNFDFITEDTMVPTIQGYAVSSAILFCVIVAILAYI